MDFYIDKATIALAERSPPCGKQGFAEFVSTEEAGRAMTRDRAFIGSRFVKLLRVPKSEASASLRLLFGQKRHAAFCLAGLRHSS